MWVAGGVTLRLSSVTRGHVFFSICFTFASLSTFPPFPLSLHYTVFTLGNGAWRVLLSSDTGIGLDGWKGLGYFFFF